MNKTTQIIKLPKFSKELAEETGIHIGDGSMNLYRSGNKNHWGYVYSSHLVDDKEYRDYVKNLMKLLYNLYPYEKTKNNCTCLVYTKKDLILFKQKVGLPMGKKTEIIIPDWIMKDSIYAKNCVRGIVDTDGCIRFRKPFKGTKRSYPNIKICNVSEPLIKQLEQIFKDFGLKPSIYHEIRDVGNTLHVLNLNGLDNLNKYLTNFGFSNNKHIKKYLFWKENGYY